MKPSSGYYRHRQGGVVRLRRSAHRVDGPTALLVILTVTAVLFFLFS